MYATDAPPPTRPECSRAAPRCLTRRTRRRAGRRPAGRLAAVTLAAAVSSPCNAVARPCSRCSTPARPPSHTEDRISECDYGDWSGRKLAELSDEPLMSVVQQHPSAAAFPGGESMRAMQARAVDAVRDWNARIEAEHGDDAAYVMCSHGDIIKAVVADALGMHLDLFQRIHADPVRSPRSVTPGCGPFFSGWATPGT
ncbi:histidine phosphatase family protein [Streptomyces sp. M10(2022)]